MRDEEDQLADIVVHLIRLAGGELRFHSLPALAVFLARERLLDDRLLTFGLDYELDVCSHELSRGYLHACDSGRVRCRGMVTASLIGPEADLEPRYAKACARAQDLLALEARELTRLARPKVIEWQHYRDRDKERERAGYAFAAPGRRERLSPLAG